ncbi:MAG: hypothetical protein ACD_71C00130G0002 [uncultured bacterium (gcode 4)]|uniref:GIY-YIG domain-containing protein n=1 Tax=uncultured bacterium (gcode 4) TaxID=1234023 RepID=K1YN94_9BACT|nr:MAG: hypothetical protein ACD_71C00130G0002 [uncultured bacterium (gcode 4)]
MDYTDDNAPIDWTDLISLYWINITTKVPEEAWIYAILYKDNESQHIFYVWQTDNLKKQLLEHISSNEPNECLNQKIRYYRCYFKYTKISLQKERDDCKALLLRKYWRDLCKEVNSSENSSI